MRNARILATLASVALLAGVAEGRAGVQVSQQVVLGLHASRAWDALTRASEVAKWRGGSADGEAVVDGRLRVHASALRA